tara:strand:- start:1845 stop:2747 length:903 start_codon:yes stop_codon:yes gene_type:complete
MAWGDGASTTSTVAGGLGKTIGDAVVAFNKANVFLPLIMSKVAMPGTKSVEFVDVTVTGAGDVTAATEGSDTTAQAMATTARTATIAEHVMQANITDLADMGYGAGSLTETAGAVIGNAIAAKLDDDIANLFAAGSLTSDACGAGTALAMSHIFDCLRLLNANSAVAPLNLALGTKQVYGAKGLQALIHDDAVTGSNVAKPHSNINMALGEALYNNGFVTRLAGFDVYTSPQITEISGDDEEGCAFSKGAFGVGIGSQGLIRMETQRDASARLTEYVGTGFWGETMIKDLFAVSLTSDVS